MMDSRFDTVVIPQRVADGGGANTPAFLVEARMIPLRVLVRNISMAADVILAFDAATLQQVPIASNTYTLPAGQADAFTLAPGQKLYGISASNLAFASVAVSEALPMDKSTT